MGVTLDESFNWSAHVDQLKKKLAGAVGIISKLKYYVDTKILVQVYHALIASRLHYAITCWGAAAQTALQPIRVLQNRAVRFISKASRYTRLDVAYLNLRIFKLEDIYKQKTTEFMRDYQQNALPPFFSNYFQGTNHTHNYPTHFATRNTFRPLKCKKIFTQRSIRFRAPSYWNELPQHIKTATTKLIFKREYKIHVFSQF